MSDCLWNDKAKRWIDKLRLVTKLAHVHNREQVLLQLDHMICNVLVQGQHSTRVLDELERRTSQLVFGAELLGEILVRQFFVNLLGKSREKKTRIINK